LAGEASAVAVWLSVLPMTPAPGCCDHGREIAELRAAVAALRQQVESLTRPAAAAADHPARPVTDGSGRSPESQTALLPAVGPDAGLPYADHRSSEATKIALFRSLFVGRDDVYAYRWENQSTGEKGWAPK
jgi:hypothetical protein